MLKYNQNNNKAVLDLVIGLYVVFLSKENTSFFCKLCVYAKTTYKPVLEERKRERAKEFRKKIYSDIWGLAPTETLGEKWYYVIFIDNSTWFTSLTLMKTKDETFCAYQDFET